MEKGISLSELTEAVQFELNQSFPDAYWVVAEIGECKVNYNGHCYLDLLEKDEHATKARIRGTIWASTYRALNGYFNTTAGQFIQTGLKVLLKVQVNFHSVYGLSLNVVDIDATYTLGDIEKRRQEVIDKLKAEGVFDLNQTLDEPDLIKRVAIISSETAAGYEDFVDQIMGNEYGFKFEHKLFPAVVQGDAAESSIVQAIERVFMEVDNFDILVVIRGGGAKNDLACFDGYWIAYHLAQFPLPVITGIGHEQDTSVADLVAYKSLKTPTAVAEYIVSSCTQKLANVQQLEHEFQQLAQSILSLNRINLERLAMQFKSDALELMSTHKEWLALSKQRVRHGGQKALQSQKYQLNENTHAISMLAKQFQKLQLDMLSQHQLKVNAFKKQTFNIQEQKLAFYQKQLDLLDPSNILKRGFSITQLNGKAIKNIKDIADGSLLKTKLHNGTLTSRVTKKD